MLETSLQEVAIEENLKQFLLVLSVSLSVATLPQVFSSLRQIPYTLLLVIVGLGLAFVDIHLVDLSPVLILTIFLPPLLFEAAWNIEWSQLKQDLIPISLYVVFGVVISVGGIAVGLNQLAGLSLTTALLIGASLSATDPVSVIALFRELGVPKRLTTLTEGESLFNDGMAVVAFSFLVSFSLGNTELAPAPILLELVKVIGIGIGGGCLIGFGISYLTQRFDLPLVEQSLTLVSTYATYLIIEDLGGSGVIGVVTMGLILGNFGSRIGMNPRTRVIVTEFWDFLAFFVNSIVFLLIGDRVRFAMLGQNLPTIAIAIGMMLLTRAIAIYGFGLVSNRIVNAQISLPDQTILWWGGLRGSVSIALALSVPTSLPGREQVIATVFGVVLFTLLVQGLTMKPLLDKLNLLNEQPLRQEYAEEIARQAALERVMAHLQQAVTRPGLDPEFVRCQTALIQGELNKIALDIEKILDENPDLQHFVAERLKEELLAIESDTYAELVRAGQLTQELSPVLQSVED